MGIRMVWDNAERTILCCITTGSWDWPDVDDALAEMHRMLDTVDHAVDYVIDMRGTRLMPRSPIWHGSRLSRGRHANSGRTVFLGAPSVVQGVINVLGKVYPELSGSLLFADSMEDARAKLAAVKARSGA